MILRPDLFDELVEGLADAIVERLSCSDGSRHGAMAENDQPGSWRLLDTAQAAALLTRSERWLRERAKRGDLPYVKLDGGPFAFDIDDLRAFVKARRVPLEEDETLAGHWQPPGKAAPQTGSPDHHRPSKPRVRP